MSQITPITLPEPIEWNSVKDNANQHIKDLENILTENPDIEALYIAALVEVCAEITLQSREQIASYWEPYLLGDNTLAEFFVEWLTFTPAPANPGKYIEYWDYLVNTDSGLLLANHEKFKPWFRSFLNFHGDWINSTSSTTTLAEWMTYKGTPEHPFNIEDYERPDESSPTGGFKSFNQFFLRNLKPGERPMCSITPSDGVVVAPCDGGVFYLDRGVLNSTERASARDYNLPGKSDRFDLLETLPGYGRYFQGGQLLDILLWFTDYHHFHAPVTGKVIHQGLYEGSYNYDFGDYDPKDFYAPNLPKDSDKVGWYQKLGKHQRYVWIIKTEEFGLVAMVAIGFWGVGSIINGLDTTGQHIEKGQYMGHFGYGGSSIVLAFRPGVDINFKVGNTPVEGPNKPVLMKVRDCLGEL